MKNPSLLKITIIIFGLLASSNAAATLFNYHQSFNDHLDSSSSSASHSGNFDISSILASYNSDPGFAITSARIIARGYSEIGSTSSVTTTPYTLSGSSRVVVGSRQVRIGSYGCGIFNSQTCYRYGTVPIYGTDAYYSRTKTTTERDDIVDEMLLQLGTDTYTAQASNSLNRNIATGTRQVSQTGNSTGGTNRYSERTFLNRSYNNYGNVELNIDVTDFLMDSLDGNLSILPWEVSASVGQFDFQLAQLTVTAVPIPAAVWLFGSAFVGLIGISRRKINNK